MKRFDDGESLGNSGMSGMWFVAEGVEKEGVETLEEWHGFIGNSVVIGEVGEFSDSEAVDGHGAVE